MARPEGFEPPAFRIGICCDIQLRHGRVFNHMPFQGDCYLPRLPEKATVPTKNQEEAHTAHERNGPEAKSRRRAEPSLPHKYGFGLPAARALPSFRQFFKGFVSVINITADRADPLWLLLLLRHGMLHFLRIQKFWKALRVASFICF